MKKLITGILATTLTLAAACGFASCDDSSKDVVKIIDVNLTEEEYAFVMDKENTTLKEDFDEFLAQLKS
ncbi:MAG: amino acid ABC transporter substrate-binding protein, partial [Clostridia bacterium]|nr:amino acid ABC transporter substrate-binding protein [Clostridia bacterium]